MSSTYAEILYLSNYIIERHEKHWDTQAIIDNLPSDVTAGLQLDYRAIFNELNLAELSSEFDELIVIH